MGRRRPYIVAGTVLLLGSLAVMSAARSYWTLFATSLLLQFASNIAHGALQGIIPDLVPKDQRGRASAVKAILELLPVVLVAVTTGRLIAAGQTEAAIWALAGIFVIAMLVTVLSAQEEPLSEPITAPLAPEIARLAGLTAVFAATTTGFGALVGLVARYVSGNLVAQVVSLSIAGLVAMAGAIIVGVWGSVRIGIDPQSGRRPSFSWWVTNRLLFLSAVGSISSFAQYFLLDVLEVPGAAEATSRLMLVVGVSTLLSAIPSGWLSDRVGRRSMVMGAGVVAATGTVLLFLVRGLPGVFLCGIVLGLATGAFMTTNWALGTELVPAAEAGRYLGVSNLASAGAGVVGAGIGGPLADLINTHQKGLGYQVVFAIYGALFLLSSVALLQVHAGPLHRTPCPNPTCTNNNSRG
jgi:MFS family permease